MNNLDHDIVSRHSQQKLIHKLFKIILLPLVLLSIFLTNTILAQPEDSLMMKLYVIETTGVPGKLSELDKHFPAHIAHQIDLEKRGIMFGAGPLSVDGNFDGPPISGMIIIRAASLQEAQEIADSDPMHANGIRTYSLRQWSLNEGTFNIRVNFSDQSLEFK